MSEKSFKEQFPSMNGLAITIMSGMEAHTTTLKIGSEEYELQRAHNRFKDVDFAIPMSAVEVYCFDKERVRQAIDKLIDTEMEHYIDVPHIAGIIEATLDFLKGELGLED